MHYVPKTITVVLFSLSLSLFADGISYPNSLGFTPNYTADSTKPDWTRPYLALMNSTLKSQFAPGITYEMFKDTHAIYCFDFGQMPGHELDHVLPKRSGGSARLDMTFAPKTRNVALVLLLYTETSQILEIDKNRQVHRDYVT